MLLICHEYKNIVLLLLAYNEWDKHSYTHRERAKDREPVATETSSSDKHPKPKRLIVDCVSLFVLHAAFSVCLFVYTFRCMNFCSFLSFHFSQKQWVIWLKCRTQFIFVYTLPNQIHSSKTRFVWLMAQLLVNLSFVFECISFSLAFTFCHGWLLICGNLNSV